MKKKIYRFILAMVIIICVNSCKKNEIADKANNNKIPDDVISAISKLGFKTGDVHTFKDGYIVEGDIYIPSSDLKKFTILSDLVIAKTEQYRTTNLVTGLPRTITISVSNLPVVYLNAASTAVNRYNSLNLKLQFQIVSSGGDIQISGFNQGIVNNFIVLGYSGVPSTTGSVYGTIGMNTNESAYGSNPDVGYVTGVIQHEIGHCIGLRHTDYFDRRYSCGPNDPNPFEPSDYDPNKLQEKSGAIQIPGTPSGADANSYMLACSNGFDRTFNANDVVALNYLYGYPVIIPAININGSASYTYNQKGNAGGTIAAPAGTLVYVSLSSYGVSNVNSFNMIGAQLSAPLANTSSTYYSASQNLLTVTNNHTAATFTMPSSGSVNWYGSFSGPSGGYGLITVGN